MLHVALFVELLRSHPRAMVWGAALAQAALWWLVPVLFYSAPPGNLPITIAVGHEFNLGSYWGPPLAGWLADIAFVIAGMPGVYLLAQACVVVTYLAVFRLGEAIVGAQQAAMAVLLMVGIASFALPTPNFGSPILAMPLTALALLHFWRAIGESRRSYWYLLAVDLGLLMLTTHGGIILFTTMAVFTIATRRGRTMLLTVEPWIAAILMMVIVFPHLLWVDVSGMGKIWSDRLSTVRAGASPFALWGRQLAALALVHAGALVLVALALGWGSTAREKVPVFRRPLLSSFERRFVLFFAIALPLTATILGASLGEGQPIGGMSPNVVLSGLAIIVLAGTTIELHRQWLVALAWSVLLLAPPVFAAVRLATMPFVVSTPMQTAQPAKAIGRFFGETFARRTGKPLPIVTGDPRLAALVALGAPARPSLFFDSTPERSPWVNADDLRRKGGIIVWRATNASGAPPPEIKARYPDLVPEVPRAFTYDIQGRMPLLRVGWGMLRPQ